MISLTVGDVDLPAQIPAVFHTLKLPTKLDWMALEGGRPEIARLLNEHLHFARFGYGHNESYISLRIFDISGREVKHFPISNLQSPIYTVVWNGRDDHGNLLPSGVYCCELRQGEFAESREILLLR